MFVRCKKNKSGSTSVQIIDKSSGKYVLYQTVGSSTDLVEIDFLISKGKKMIADDNYSRLLIKRQGQQSIMNLFGLKI